MEFVFFILFLGILQGATEFLPISSSGHLAMIENLEIFSQYSDQIRSGGVSLLTFNVFLHFGTILAVLIFWRKDIIYTIKSGFDDMRNQKWDGSSFRYNLAILIGILPAIIVPFFKSYIEKITESLLAVAILFILNGLILIITNLFIKREKNIEKIANQNFWKPLLIGFFQIFAVLPGISRSGMTIVAGFWLKLSGDEAIKFSFFISIPVLIAAAFLEAKEVFSNEILVINWRFIFLGALTSFLSGLASLKILVWFSRRLIISPFGIYTFLLGSLIIGKFL